MLSPVCSSAGERAGLLWGVRPSSTPVGSAPAGTRTLRCDKADFLKAGDTFMIERDTGKAEEAIADSVTDDGTVTTRSNLLFGHGPAAFAVEGGSGEVGMTVVTHDGTDFLIEQAGPLYEDGEMTFDASMIGGTTTPPPTTTEPPLTATTDSPMHAGDTSVHGTVGASAPVGVNGVQIETQVDHGTGFLIFFAPGQPQQLSAAADHTWSRAVNALTVKTGFKFRCRVRRDASEPWIYSNEVTAGAALAPTKSAVCSLTGPLYGGQVEIKGTMPPSATATATAQIVIKAESGEFWLTVGVEQAVGTGTFSLLAGGAALIEGRTYSVRSRDFAGAEWSGDLDGRDGRLALVQMTALPVDASVSPLASINEPVHVTDTHVGGFLSDPHATADSEGQIVILASNEQWKALMPVSKTGQFGPSTWSFPMPVSVATGSVISIRTRVSPTGPWSGDLMGSDGRLRSIAVKVQA